MTMVLDRTSLSDLTVDEWRQRGRELALRRSDFAWDVGDWLNEGATRWGSDIYLEAEHIFDIGKGTLQNYASVSRRFSQRNENLSFSHHALVAAIPEEAADAWLSLAAERGWSWRELREQLKAVQQLPPGEPETVAVMFRITVPTAEEELWQRAAAQRKLSVEDWLVAVANEAAKAA